MHQLPKKQIPERFKDLAAHLGIGIQHFIKTYAIRDDYLGQHKRGEIELSDEERMYLMSRQGIKNKKTD